MGLQRFALRPARKGCIAHMAQQPAKPARQRLTNAAASLQAMCVTHMAGGPQRLAQDPPPLRQAGDLLRAGCLPAGLGGQQPHCVMLQQGMAGQGFARSKGGRPTLLCEGRRGGMQGRPAGCLALIRTSYAHRTAPAGTWRLSLPSASSPRISRSWYVPCKPAGGLHSGGLCEPAMQGSTEGGLPCTRVEWQSASRPRRIAVLHKAWQLEHPVQAEEHASLERPAAARTRLQRSSSPCSRGGAGRAPGAGVTEG